MTAEQIVDEILFWTNVQAKQVPAKRAFLNKRAEAQSAAQERFSPWLQKDAFKSAKAAVEAGMGAAAAVLPDYDLAVHERALGQMALSGNWELVPKRKTAGTGAESASRPSKPPATPVNPPNGSGGPPVKPSGSGPDLGELKQQMLRNPENTSLRRAYLKASMAAAKT